MNWTALDYQKREIKCYWNVCVASTPFSDFESLFSLKGENNPNIRLV